MRFIFQLLLIAVGLSQFSVPACSDEMFPLEPPDLSSPQSTVQSFLQNSARFVEAAQERTHYSEQTEHALRNAVRCIDLSEIPPNLREDVGFDAVLRLREILDRVPDFSAASLIGSAQDPAASQKWRVPHTDLVIAQLSTGPHAAAYTFTADTVRHLREYHERVRHLPANEHAFQGVYQKLIYSPGWMIPRKLLEACPEWSKVGVFDQAIWQWILTSILVAGSIMLFRYARSIQLRWTARYAANTWQLSKLLSPVVAMALAHILKYLLDDQLNLTGQVLHGALFLLEGLSLGVNSWMLIVGSNIIMHGILALQNIKEEALDADVIKLACRLLAFGGIFVLFYVAGNDLGIPVSAIFTSAGIIGAALALAARETLANFFGGVSIFLDRPFRAGDYIILDSGERGEVKAVGMRSTRIQTRDDVLIAIPNSVITNAKIVNQSLPQPHFRVHVKLGVSYSADLDRAEEVLIAVARQNPLAVPDPEPRVRIRGFGDSAINLELLAWVARPADHGLLLHELNKAICRQFKEANIDIAYPQLDLHVVSTDNSIEHALDYQQ